MTAAALARGDCNVVWVTWFGGNGLPYAQAAGNTRVVGAEVAALLNYLQSGFGLEARSVHVIGHSLGAHIAGFAGERVAGMGRITGLDPAHTCFNGTPPEVRLDPSDAVFVDVIHTDTAGLLESMAGIGAEQAMGHLDFYPNGGKYQPGCDRSEVLLRGVRNGGVFDLAAELIGCNHVRSIDLMLDSFAHPASYEAYRCRDYSHFTSGECSTCATPPCSVNMGILASKDDAEGDTGVTLYLRTGSRSPFAVFHYFLEVRVSAESPRTERGDLYLAIVGDERTTDPIKVNDEAISARAGATLRFAVVTAVEVGEELRGLALRWTCRALLLSPSTWCTFRDNPRLVLGDVALVRGRDHRTVRLSDITVHAAVP